MKALLSLDSVAGPLEMVTFQQKLKVFWTLPMDQERLVGCSFALEARKKKKMKTRKDKKRGTVWWT